MIVTVTPNPSLDRTLEVEELRRGEVVRAHADRSDPGGKGVNVSRALVANGHPSRAVLPLGGADGELLAALLTSLGIEVAAVPIADAIRSNVTVVEPDGTVTKLNAPGPRLSVVEVEALLERAVAVTDGAAWVVASGSLAPGTADDLYARLTAAVRPAGARVAVDTSGPALQTVLAARPGRVEAERGGAERGDRHGSRDARGRRTRRQRAPLERGGIRARLPRAQRGRARRRGPGLPCGERSDRAEKRVGAGDALLAGFLAAGGAQTEALAEGVAWGAAACVLPGTAVPGPGDLQRDLVQTHPVDPGRPLALDADRRRSTHA